VSTSADTKPVRPGEEIDAARLAASLGKPVDAIEQFPAGHSNLTYLVRSGEKEMVLRRPPFGSTVKTAHDMGREFRILTALDGVYPRAPRPIASCDDLSVIGAPFYLMERVRGVILRGLRPPKGVALEPATMRALSETFVDALAELHAIDWHRPGLADLAHPEGYVERQVRGWSDRYAKARTDDIPEMERAADWLAAHRPPDSPRPSLVHNDFKYDNLVLAPERLTDIRAVLDWEMATIGDPLMDLGTSLGYWVDASDPEEMLVLPLGPTALPGNLTRAEIVARYQARTGTTFDPVFYYVFGLFKVAVIAQQIYARYAKGLTKDERFAAMILGVGILARQAARAIEGGRV
jgi:aminoglycoside phosphotransferase (APT) family kinase protein